MAGKQRAKQSSGKDLNPIKSAMLLRLAQGPASRAELLAELKEQGHDPKLLAQTWNELVKEGVIRADAAKGKYSPRQDFPTFKIVFGIVRGRWEGGRPSGNCLFEVDPQPRPISSIDKGVRPLRHSFNAPTVDHAAR